MAMMSQSDLQRKRPSERRRRQRGQELVEFSLVLVPMFALTFIFMDIAWGIYNKAAIEAAVRTGCRYGITNHIPDPYQPSLCGSSSTITDCIGQHVINAAPGILANASIVPQGSTCSASKCITVQYFAPSGVAATGQLNQGGNIIEVQVTGYNNGSVSGMPMSTLITPFIAQNSTWYTSATSVDTMSSVLTYPNP
jgi:TadE-like protein